MNILLIFFGGGLGAVARWTLSTSIEQLVLHTPLHRFPFGILACNLLGCFAVGCAFGALAQRHPSWIFPFLVTGFLGGFTTFSTFGYETITLAHGGQFGLAALNLLLSNGLGLAAAWVGARLAVAVYGS